MRWTGLVDLRRRNEEGNHVMNVGPHSSHSDFVLGSAHLPQQTLAVLMRWIIACFGSVVCAIAIGVNAAINYVVFYQYGSTVFDARAFGCAGVAAVALKIMTPFVMVPDRRDQNWGATIIAAIVWFACAAFSISATLAVMTDDVHPRDTGIPALRLFSDSRPRQPEVAPSTHGTRPTKQRIQVIAGWAGLSDDRIALLLGVLAAVCFELAASFGPHIVWSLTLRHSRARGASTSDDHDHFAGTPTTIRPVGLDRSSSETKSNLMMERSDTPPPTDLAAHLRTFMKVQTVHNPIGAIGATDLFERFRAAHDFDISQRRFGDLMAKQGYCDKGRETGSGRVIYLGLSWRNTGRPPAEQFEPS